MRARSRHKSKSLGSAWMIPDGHGGMRQVRPHEFATVRRMKLAGASNESIALYLNLTSPAFSR